MESHGERIAEDDGAPWRNGPTFDQPRPIQSAGTAPTGRPGAGRCDVEQRISIARGRAHPDDGPEGAEEKGRRRRDEVRQTHRRAVVSRGEVVAELVGTEDPEEGEPKESRSRASEAR